MVHQTWPARRHRPGHQGEPSPRVPGPGTGQHRACGRGIVAATEDRPHRLVLRALRRPGCAAGRHPRCFRRPGEGGEGAPRRYLELFSRADPGVDRGGRRQPVRQTGCPAASLQPGGTATVRGRTTSARREVRPRRIPVLGFGERVPHRQVPHRGRCRRRRAQQDRRTVLQPRRAGGGR